VFNAAKNRIASSDVIYVAVMARMNVANEMSWVRANFVLMQLESTAIQQKENPHATHFRPLRHRATLNNNPACRVIVDRIFMCGHHCMLNAICKN
jgi:hypothetical protein